MINVLSDRVVHFRLLNKDRVVEKEQRIGIGFASLEDWVIHDPYYQKCVDANIIRPFESAGQEKEVVEAKMKADALKKELAEQENLLEKIKAEVQKEQEELKKLEEIKAEVQKEQEELKKLDETKQKFEELKKSKKGK